MKIADIDIRAVKPSGVVDEVEAAELRGNHTPDAVVIFVQTDKGMTEVAFGSGGLHAENTARAFE